MFTAVLDPQMAFQLIGMLMMLFFAVLFLQSGIDKVADRKGNLGWLTGHFSKSILSGVVPFLLTLLTIMELAVGLGGLLGALAALLPETFGKEIPFWVSFAATATLLALFTGQRIAKDYGGAAGIVPYFIVSVGGMVLFALSAA